MSTSNKTPTIYDVAKLSGVSIATISRVLNAPSLVKADTRKRVLQAIDDLSFVPKAAAHAHARQQSNRIGVLTPYFTAPSFVQRLRGVATALSQVSHELVIYPVDSMDRLHGYLSSLPVTQTIDGLIIISAHVDSAEVRRLVKRKLQTILIEYPQEEVNSIEIDDEGGGRLVAQYLMAKGHRRIAFLGDTNMPEFGIDPITLRLKGFAQALEQAGMRLPKDLIHLSRYGQKEMHYGASELLSLSPAPTAIFAATDVQAVGVLRVARQLGLRIPDDLAVVGFDDLDIAETLDLTTVRQHLDESGRLAVEILLSGMRDVHRPPQHAKLPLELIERGTA
jgi:LacI family transcriptional regulator, galactose operon repressor